MKHAHLVIGSNYGDEGKGQFVDYLAFQYPHAPTVRFSGGSNAGHTVHTSIDQHHVFHALGSNAFVNPITILTRDFILNPVLLMNEIIDFPYRPQLYIDPRAIVTTPFDVYFNQAITHHAHGSTGTGIQQTIQRHQHFPLTASMLQLPHIEHYLFAILEKYYQPLAESLNLTLPDPQQAIQRFLSDTQSILDLFAQLIPDTEVINGFDTLIFEGSQGLFLDQYSQDFPFVTPSNTGFRNLIRYLDPDSLKELHVYFITRSYLTRHGKGPLNNPWPDHYADVFIQADKHDKTNIPNPYQGSLRYASLDLPRMHNTTSEQLQLLNHLNPTIHAAVTWADLSFWAPLPTHNLIPQFYNIKKALNAKHLLLSYSKTRDSIFNY